jgi:heterodisulfide reductase subunit D
LAKENIEQLNSLGIEALITNCAGCYKTIRNDYPEVGKLNFKVMHVTELYEQLINEGKLRFKKEIAKRVTYHDPCHLGKHSDFYDPPRNVVKSIPGINLIEMYPTREHGFCCGGGGGLASGFRDLATKVGMAKLKKALQTGADILSSTCPFCYQNFLVALGNIEAKITFKDVTELLADSVSGS